MTIAIPSPPRTIMEVYKMLPEGTLAELINGQIYMSPAPSTEHQRTSRKVFFELISFVEKHSLGEMFHSPYDVFLDETRNAVQPDLVFVTNKNKSIIKPQGIIGVPDLLIEILSPGNNQHDLMTKRELYERFGVSEYWIVDPHSKETLVYHLNGKVYSSPIKDTGKLFSLLFNHSFTI